MQKLRNIFAFCTLLVFLFPLVEKEEHHCNLCDFTNDVLESQTFFHHDLLTHEIGLLNYFFHSADEILQKEVFRPLRAPPALV